jgi:hypothetical protein
MYAVPKFKESIQQQYVNYLKLQMKELYITRHIDKNGRGQVSVLLVPCW